MWNNRVSEKTGLKCPITGSDLLYTGYEEHTMDGDSYYESSSDPKVKYTKNARSKFYELVDKNEYVNYKERIANARYFHFEHETGTWEEYFAVASTSFPLLFKVGTSAKEVTKCVRKDKREHDKRAKEYERKVASGEIKPVIVTRILPTLVSSEIVKVCPMSPPSSLLFYFDTIIKSK